MFNFKDKQDYLNQRKNLVDEAQALLNEGKNEEAEAKMNDIEACDNAWNDFAKELANKAALEDRLKGLDMANRSVSVPGGVASKVTNICGEVNIEEQEKSYVNAWAKAIMGKGNTMTDEEKSVFELKNAALSTETHGVLIPNTVVSGIWEKIGETYPLWDDIANKTHVKGTLEMIKEDDGDEASWYDEATSIAEGEESFATFTLSGCELARDITVTWKLKEMAIDDFIPYIQRKLAKKIGKALAYGVVSGKGKPGLSDSFKPEPKGIVTALEAESSTPRIVTYGDSDPVTYQKLTGIMAKIKSGYAKGMAIYANNTTIWDVLANVLDTTGKPYFVPDATSGGVGRLFGKVVKEDDSIPTDGILFANVKEGYAVNFNKDIILDQEDHKKSRTTDYIAYGIVDGDVVTTDAFVYLKKAQA